MFNPQPTTAPPIASTLTARSGVVAEINWALNPVIAPIMPAQDPSTCRDGSSAQNNATRPNSTVSVVSVFASGCRRPPVLRVGGGTWILRADSPVRYLRRADADGLCSAT